MLRELAFLSPSPFEEGLSLSTISSLVELLANVDNLSRTWLALVDEDGREGSCLEEWAN